MAISVAIDVEIDCLIIGNGQRTARLRAGDGTMSFAIDNLCYFKAN